MGLEVAFQSRFSTSTGAGKGMKRDFQYPKSGGRVAASLGRSRGGPQRATQPGGKSAHIPVRRRSPRRIEVRIPSSGNIQLLSL